MFCVIGTIHRPVRSFFRHWLFHQPRAARMLGNNGIGGRGGAFFGGTGTAPGGGSSPPAGAAGAGAPGAGCTALSAAGAGAGAGATAAAAAGGGGGRSAIGGGSSAGAALAGDGGAFATGRECEFALSCDDATCACSCHGGALGERLAGSSCEALLDIVSGSAAGSAPASAGKEGERYACQDELALLFDAARYATSRRPSGTAIGTASAGCGPSLDEP